jgi:hypothetical protein
MKTELNQCAQCGNHIHPEHEVSDKKTGKVLCIGCSWVWVNDDEEKA